MSHSGDHWLVKVVKLNNIFKFTHCHDSKLANGLLFTFGWNHYGQLGHGAPCFGGEDLQLVPKIVEGLKSHFVVQVACGEQHTMALVRS